MTSNDPLRCSWKIFAKNDGAFDGKRAKLLIFALKGMIWMAGLSDLPKHKLSMKRASGTTHLAPRVLEKNSVNLYRPGRTIFVDDHAVYRVELEE